MIKEKIGEDFEFREIKPYSAFEFGDYKIMAIPVKHSVIFPIFDPTVCWKINGLIYSEDIDQDFFLSKESDKLKKYMKDAELIFLDGALWKRKLKGHMDILDILPELQRWNIKNVIFTQIGRSSPKHEDLRAFIKQVDESYDIAFDDMSIKFYELDSMHAIKNTEGLYLVAPHGKMIWQGNKTIIVKSKEFRGSLGKSYYLIEGNRCYGIIKIKSIHSINLEKFKELFLKHRITDEERYKWWMNKQILFAYEFELIKKFKEPRYIEKPKGIQIFIKNVKFLNLNTIDNIENIKEYDPAKPNNEQLADDWRTVCRWYATKKSGKKIKFSLEDIVNLAKIIYEEISKRIKAGTMKHEFEPEKMTHYVKELYNRIRARQILADGSTLKQFLDGLQDFTLSKDFLCLVGSITERGEGNDIDVLVRMKYNSFMERALIARLTKMLEAVGIDKKVHVFFEPEGPHGNFISLADLKCKLNIPFRSIEMQEVILDLVSINRPFLPMKPRKRFYKIEDTINYIFEKENKFAIEKKYNGFRGVLHKKGSQIKLYSDQAKDISSAFPTIISQTTELADSDIILDGELVGYEDKKVLGRNELAKFIGAVKSGKKLDDSHIIFHAFDCLYFDENIDKRPWHERKLIMNKLKFTKNIQKTYSIVVNTPAEAKKAMIICKNLKGSEGAIIKKYDSIYESGKETDAWIKFRVELETHLVVLKVNPINNAVNYTVGIYIPEKELAKINPKYIEEFKGRKVMNLGNTFNTLIKANIGDILDVNVEEVWRHEHKETIRYSLHKPKVMNVAKAQEISSLNDLDSMVVSRGVAIKEMEMKAKDEGGEIMVKNFPDRMQKNFRAGISKWQPYVLHLHSRGRGLHYDLRCLTPAGYLEGFTLFARSVDDPVDLRKTKSNIRGTIKNPQPKEWLKISGISKPEEIGATKKTPGVFVIVGKGEYTILETSDHKIVLEFKSDKGKIDKSPIKRANEQYGDEHAPLWNPGEELIDITGKWSYHIAHIGDRWVILFDKLIK